MEATSSDAPNPKLPQSIERDWWLGPQQKVTEAIYFSPLKKQMKRCNNYCYRPVFLLSLKINTNMHRKSGSRKAV